MKLEAVEVESHDGAQPPNKCSSQPVLYQSLLERHLQALFTLLKSNVSFRFSISTHTATQTSARDITKQSQIETFTQ